MFAFFESPRRVLKLASHLVICAMAVLVIGSLLAYSLSAYISITCLMLGPPADRSGAHDTAASAIQPQDAQVNCIEPKALHRARADPQVPPGGPPALRVGEPFFN